MSSQVKNMFSRIARKYDLMNDMLSFGIHRIWRKRLVKELRPQNKHKILDCATGTGDLAFAFKKAAPQSQVTGIDFTPEMIDIARQKTAENHLEVDFSVADAMELPFENDYFDMATISFGIRNVDSPVIAMEQMCRVVKPGGIVAILEFGQPKGLFALPYKIYSRFIMPAAGRLIARDEGAYEYLPRTAAVFPGGSKFVTIMRNSGLFSRIHYIKLSFGIAYIYIGTVS